MGSWGQVLGGVGSLAAGGAAVGSSLSGKSSAEEAQRLQRQYLAQQGSLGGSATTLGLEQLDLSRQLADRQIDLANQILTATEPFRGYTTDVLTGTGAGTGGAALRQKVYQMFPQMAGYDDTQIPFWAQEQARAAMGTGTGDPATLTPRTFTPVRFGVTPAERDALESQYRVARESTIANSPVRGGGLASQLLDLNQGRANAVVGLESDVARRNQSVDNAAALTNFQHQIDTDRFNASNAFTKDQLRTNLAAQIGFQAPGVSLSGLGGAQGAYSPSTAASVYGPALAATSGGLGVSGQNFSIGNTQSAAGGQALGSLAAAGKLAGMKQGGKSSTGFGK
jgi:hypothetical protein